MRYHVVVWDLRDVNSAWPDSAAGEYDRESDARLMLAEYLAKFATIYKWAIELHENGNVTILSQGERNV